MSPVKPPGPFQRQAVTRPFHVLRCIGYGVSFPPDNEAAHSRQGFFPVMNVRAPDGTIFQRLAGTTAITVQGDDVRHGGTEKRLFILR